ncbi:MAG: ester cyclase, partial [Candidatus Eremiobacteraeota bacterium]|nr:ester cyclase [Candidatus Eremiobacteraeota bacterium]
MKKVEITMETGSAPRIDFANLPAPAEGILVTLFITVRNVAVSREFYSRILGGTVVMDENPCMVRLSNSWIIMNPGGPPTPDKPGISVVDYEPDNTTSIFLNLRVANIQACYEEWKAKGVEFLTPPIDRGAEIRCYMRDPDGYLIEVGQATGLLQGKLANSAARGKSSSGTYRGFGMAPMIRRLLATLVLAAVVIPPLRALSGETPVTHQDVTRAWADAWNSHDIAKVLALFAKHVQIDQPANEKPLDYEGAGKFFSMIFKAYPDFHVTVVEAIV